MDNNRLAATLCCPECESRPQLQAQGEHLVCPECGREYPVRDGIPNLLPSDLDERDTASEEMSEAQEEARLAELPNDIRVLVIHGPNLNLLGTREPEIYGRETLQDINERLQEEALALGCHLHFIQSNHEGEIVTAIQSVREECEAIVINPAAYTHTSVAIRDALAAMDCPRVEVHLSNIHAREDFRSNSITGAVVNGIVSGFGGHGYILALQAAVELVRRRG